MPSTLESCESFFGTKDLYKVFDIDKKATVAEIKKAYYKKALLVHPDRVPEGEKKEATEKFKVLAKVNEVLNDDGRRALYDEQGIIQDEDDEKFGSTWLEAFKNLFKPITDSDIDNYKKNYIGSELEKTDLKKAYVNGKGCINYMMEHIPFMTVVDEERFRETIDEWIASGEVEDFEAFTNEPHSKRNRRHKKYAREFKEAEEIKKKMNASKELNDENDLAKQIAKRQQQRSGHFGSFLEQMMQKYANEDDDDQMSEEEFQLAAKKLKKGKKSTAKPKKETPIKGGRVSKRNK